MKRISIQGFIVSLLLAVLISACNRSEPAKDGDRAANRKPAEVAAQQRAESQIGPASASMAGAGALPEDLEAAADEFSSDTCTENCPGHEAGYAWAEQHAVTDPNECGGQSNSFFEGCMAYAQEQRQDRDTREE